MKKYFPFLLAKAGEFTALTHLQLNVKQEIAPIIQTLDGSFDKVEAFGVNHWNFKGNKLFIDFTFLSLFDRSETKLLLDSLIKASVNVIPVLQKDSDIQLKNLVKTFFVNGKISEIGIKTLHSITDTTDTEKDVSAILGSIGIDKSKATLLFDLGFVGANSYKGLATSLSSKLKKLKDSSDYMNIVVTSSSFPIDLTQVTPAGKAHKLPRYEWLLWKSLTSDAQISKLITYGDYGAKHPTFSDSGFPGTCSIKYTLQDDFLIYKGKLSKEHPDGNGQYITFAKLLVKSSDYSGPTFSWGDNRIDFFASQSIADPKRKTGNSTSWVEISQNHHITMLHSLL